MIPIMIESDLKLIQEYETSINKLTRVLAVKGLECASKYQSLFNDIEKVMLIYLNYCNEMEWKGVKPNELYDEIQKVLQMHKDKSN